MKLLEIQSLLKHNVPRFTAHIKNRGGVSALEWEWLRCEKESPDYLVGVLAHAEKYLLFPQDEKTFTSSLFVLVKALAIMSFIPGGISIFGLRFWVEIDNFVEIENDQT